MHEVLDTELELEPWACCMLGTPLQPCLKPYFPFLLLTGMNTKATIERQKGRKEKSRGPLLCCQKSSACPLLLAAHRLVHTLDFVVVVILEDGNGDRVVIFHLQQGSLMAGSNVFHLKERHGHWLSGELG